VAIPRRRSLPFALGIIRSRTGSGRKLRSFSEARSPTRKSRHPSQRDGRRSPAVHPSGPGTLVTPHPIPRDQKESRIGDEIEQIIEPAMRIITAQQCSFAWIFSTLRSASYKADSSSSVFTGE